MGRFEKCVTFCLIAIGWWCFWDEKDETRWEWEREERDKRGCEMKKMRPGESEREKKETSEDEGVKASLKWTWWGKNDHNYCYLTIPFVSFLSLSLSISYSLSLSISYSLSLYFVFSLSSCPFLNSTTIHFALSSPQHIFIVFPLFNFLMRISHSNVHHVEVKCVRVIITK